MRRFITIIFLLVLILFPSCKNIRERGLFGKKARTLEMLRAEQQRVRVADSLKRIENRLKAMEEARLDSLRMAAEAEKAAFEAIDKFNIVVGSFITPEFAQAWSEEYRKQGYNTRIIRMTDSRFELVVAESYNQFSKAVERLNIFQTTVDVDTWLYVHR